MLEEHNSSFLCFLSAILYVLSLYLLPEKIRMLSRDDRTHIKWRMVACTLSTVIVAGSVVYYYESIKNQSHLHHVPILEAMGLRFDTQAVQAALTTILLMLVFYSGPIITRVVILFLMGSYHIDALGSMTPFSEKAKRNRERMKVWIGGSFLYQLQEHFKLNWSMLNVNRVASFRNHVFAPVSEELAFRSIIVLLLLAKYKIESDTGLYKANSTVGWEVAQRCPMWFGVAHLHHAIAKVSKDRSVWKVALAESLLQFVYTSIFGYIASLLLLRTGTVLAPIVSHVICNLFGLPDVGFMTRPGSRSSTDTSVLYNYRYAVAAIHVGGLALFAYLLCPLTDTFTQSSALWFGRGHPIVR